MVEGPVSMEGRVVVPSFSKIPSVLLLMRFVAVGIRASASPLANIVGSNLQALLLQLGYDGQERSYHGNLAASAML